MHHPRRVLALLAAVIWSIPLHGQSLGRAEALPASQFDLQHARLELQFDLDQRIVMGTATLRLVPLASGWIHLDATGLDILEVRADGVPAEFRNGTGGLEVRLDKSPAVEMQVRYRAAPHDGLFFSGRDSGGRPAQIWTQGFPDRNQYWFPGSHRPDDHATSELILHVPEGWTAVSNGRLLRREGGVFHWLQDEPHATYLISFAAGRFLRTTASYRGVPLDEYTPPDMAAAAGLTFGRTPAALDFFSAKLGRYPWARHGQILLNEAIYGGMENTGAVTYSPRLLVEPGLVGDRQGETDLAVAHELAHQWFGDLVGFADFRHLWLSEGFATCLANLWGEDFFGPEDAAWARWRSARDIVAEKGTGQFSVVRKTGQTGDPTALLVYLKGAWVLHMLRARLGDDAFWAVLRDYLARFKYRAVTTGEFLDVLGQRAGQGVVRFARQFLYGTGHPVLAVGTRWKPGEIVVQVQQQAPLFQVPLEVELAGPDGVSRHRLEVAGASEAFSLPFQGRVPPKTVRVDPDGKLLADIRQEKGNDEWLYDLRHDARVPLRAKAIHALDASPESLAAIGVLLRDEPFYGLRQEAVEALASMGDPAALRLAAVALHDSEPQVRQAAVESVKGRQGFREAIVAAARSDPSPSVRAAAIRALPESLPDGAADVILPLLEEESPADLVRCAALDALGALGNVRFAPVASKFAGPGNRSEVAAAAVGALGRMKAWNHGGREALEAALENASIDVRQAAVEAWTEAAPPSQAARLESFAASERIAAIADRARRGARAMRARTKPAK